MRRSGAVFTSAVALLAVALSACGGESDAEPDSAGKTLSDGTTLEKSIHGIFTNSGLVDYEITDSEIRIELDAGSKDDAIGGCTSATAINAELIEARTILIVYPDGEVTCD